MPSGLIPTFIMYCFVTAITPGPANLVWLFTGAGMQRFFMKYQKPVNIVMALSLVICAISIVMI
jgi:cysteine/O-acetylserine efflux protein